MLWYWSHPLFKISAIHSNRRPLSRTSMLLWVVMATRKHATAACALTAQKAGTSFHWARIRPAMSGRHRQDGSIEQRPDTRGKHAVTTDGNSGQGSRSNHAGQLIKACRQANRDAFRRRKVFMAASDWERHTEGMPKMVNRLHLVNYHSRISIIKLFHLLS